MYDRISPQMTSSCDFIIIIIVIVQFLLYELYLIQFSIIEETERFSYHTLTREEKER